MAVVKEASADTFFMTYLDEVEKSSPDLLKAGRNVGKGSAGSTAG
ncbi:MAG: hypothetical protein ACLR6B_11810 [Blautia sp.]